MKKSWTIKNLDELDSFAQQLVQLLSTQDTQSKATVVTLSGELGAGKTTLTQHIGQHLGIREPINSPTFVISKYYDLKSQVWSRLIHVDAYRLDGENLDPMGFDELFADPNNLVIIEWPQYIESVLPKEKISVTITQKENHVRQIVLK